MASFIGRRKFLATLGGAVAAWPLAARAQQGERVRRIGVLLSTHEGDPARRVQLTAFEYAIGAKWLELLKEIAPNITRAVVLRDPTIAAGIGQFAAIQATAPFGIELSAVGLHDSAAIESAVAAFARDANGGLVMTAAPFGGNHPDVIATLAARYKLPAVYPFRYFVNAGGLMSYGSDLPSQFRSAAQYVDRILKGEKPADLPVQAPTKYELVINLKTAKALGLDVPQTLLARADEVIE